MVYCCLALMGALSSRLDRAQRRALAILGASIRLPTLHRRCLVAALTYLYKLMYLPDDHPLKRMLLAPSIAKRIPPTPVRCTRLSQKRFRSLAFPLALSLPARTRYSIINAFAACAIPAWKSWNDLPHDIIPAQPCAHSLQTFHAFHLQSENTSRTVWRYNLASWPRLRAYFRQTDWTALVAPGHDPESVCQARTNHIQQGMKQFIPSKTLTTCPSDPKWWTPECSTAVLAIDSAWKKWRRMLVTTLSRQHISTPSPLHLRHSS